MKRLDPGIAKTVGARIRELRLDAEMSREELALRIDSYGPIVSRIETGKHLVDLRTVASIAAALELDVATVLVCLDGEWIAADCRRTAVRAGITQATPSPAARRSTLDLGPPSTRCCTTEAV